MKATKRRAAEMGGDGSREPAGAGGRGGSGDGSATRPSTVTVAADSGGSFAVRDDAGEVSQMTIMPLGAGNEVGRSCLVLKFKGKTIMFDCGIHPAYQGIGALPFFDMVDDSEVDILFISHFHLDHAASLPFFTEKTEGFKGRVFMTHPTKAVMKMILDDYMKVSSTGSGDGRDEQLYDERDLRNCLDRVETVDFHQSLTVAGVKFTFLNAGHVLGAAMISVEIAGVRVLYTGDYSCDEDRHLMPARPPMDMPPHVLIVEATYGVQTHETREVREKRFTNAVEETVKRNGRCLIPVFALGRAQELLLILEEYWEKHPELHDIPIFYASKLASKSLGVYRTYIAHMNKHMQANQDRNPFNFRHITDLKAADSFDDVGPSVVMASPGMLQNGLSRQLFEKWCGFSSNTTLLAGYSVEGTLAKKIQSQPDEVTALNGRILPLRCNVKYISFSAHADFLQTSNFIQALQPPTIVLVHGEFNEMRRLHTEVSKKYKDKEGFQCLMPGNCEEVTLDFTEERSAQAIGNIAKRRLVQGGRVRGVIVAKDFNYQLMEAKDVPAHTALTAHAVLQKQHIPFRQSSEVLRHFLESLFPGKVKEVQIEKESSLVVCGKVTVSVQPPDRVLLAWAMSPAADMIADAVVAVIMQARAGLASVKLTTAPHSHGDNSGPRLARARLASKLLRGDFGTDNVAGELGEGDGVLTVSMDGKTATIALADLAEKNAGVTCSSKGLEDRLVRLMKNVASTIQVPSDHTHHDHDPADVGPTKAVASGVAVEELPTATETPAEAVGAEADADMGGGDGSGAAE